MKTMIKKKKKKIDKKIPDATPDTVKAQVNEIGKNAKDTAMCIVATNVCLYKTAESTVELALMIGKTSTKKAVNVMNNWYVGTPAMTVRR